MRQNLRTTLRYAAVLVVEFGWTLGGIAVAVCVGGLLYAITPHAQLGGRPPSLVLSAYAAWMALFAQAPLSPPETWYLAVLTGVYPLLGFVLLGEGIVRFGLLMLSRRQGERWWMKAMASTYRDHIVVCGLGHVGYRVFDHLVAGGARVVAIEKDPACRFLAKAKETGAPVLVRDMKEDQALVDAGVPHARAIVIATNDDMANLEVALDARRMSATIRVVMRLFDQQIAAKVAGAFGFDFAFSASALAAPTVAAMAFGSRVLGTHEIGGQPYVVVEVPVEAGSALAGRPIAALESTYRVRVLARKGRDGAVISAPETDTPVGVGETVVVHGEAERSGSFAAAGRIGTA